MKSSWCNDPDRIEYFDSEETRYGRKAIDEFVVHNAHIHLESMDDSTFWLNVDNDIHNWTFIISSHSGRAKVMASLIEDNSPDAESKG